MNRGVNFWVFMFVFQVAFGLAVFALTRSYYVDRPMTAQPPASHATGAGLPRTDPGSEMEQLMDLYPAGQDQTDPQQILQQADEDFASGRYERAGQGYTQLIQTGRAGVDIYNNLGITLHYLGRSNEALEILDQGIATDPQYQRIWLTQGFVNSQVGNFDQAKAAFNMAMSLGPDTEVGQAAKQMLDQLQ
jgi:tetratricopeptide (TPR) repeat protein